MLRQSVLEGEEVSVKDTPTQEGIEPLLGLLYSNYRRYSPRRFRSPPPRGRTPP
ncbi:hypothetical protein A2U01_0034604, partial [Trifolium medium]|nr:hypothetical protein [Trifolium medium]